MGDQISLSLTQLRNRDTTKQTKPVKHKSTTFYAFFSKLPHGSKATELRIQVTNYLEISYFSSFRKCDSDIQYQICIMVKGFP